MLRKTQAIDCENNENLNSPLLEKKRCCKFTYFILPVSHALCIAFGIFIGLRIDNWGEDGSL